MGRCWGEANALITHGPTSAAAQPRHEVGRTVVYIVGSGRSGSTLLERVLGQIPGFVNVGELTGLFPRVASQNYTCGCGETFDSCDFWVRVGARAFGGWDPEWVRDVAELQQRVVRQRQLVRLAVPLARTRQYRVDLERFADIFDRLYESVAVESACRVIVDASKSPMQLLALRQIAGLDLRVLHLVRDSRGVAYSWSKSDVVLPHLREQRKVMSIYSPHRLALRWSAFQAESSLLSTLSSHGHRMRYEDLVAEPAASVLTALRSLQLPFSAEHLRHIGSDQVELGRTHGLAGSRSRFNVGTIGLTVDDEWRSRLARRSKDVVTVLSLPHLLRYGYLTTHRAEEPSEQR